jgi:hypothetical protein
LLPGSTTETTDAIASKAKLRTSSTQTTPDKSICRKL